MLFGTRMVHFSTIIWSGQGDGIKMGTEVWDDGNIVNNDGFKTPRSDGETSDTLYY